MIKSVFLATTMLICGGISSFTNAQTTKSLKEVMKLEISEPGGANGGSVAWHPVLKRYFAAMAGNADFPLQVFDTKGMRVSAPDQHTLFDVRGLWYNPKNKTLQTNGPNDNGWAEYKLDAKGMPAAARKLPVTTTQPDFQSVGAYDAKKNAVYFFDYALVGVESHSATTGATDVSSTTIWLGITSAKNTEAADQESTKIGYNENAMIFTGIPKAEVGLENTELKQIELYNVATGLLTQVLKLPSDAPTQTHLKFSYCNGIYWLFDKGARVWHGYK